MSAYPPPQENVPIFDSGLFTTNDSQLTISQLKLSFLQFPQAQTATESIPNLAITSSGTAPTAGAASNDGTIATTAWVNLYGGGTATNIAGGVANNIPYQTAASTTGFIPVGTAGQVLTAGVAGLPAWAPASGGGATSVLYTTTQTITFATAGRREFMCVGAGGASAAGGSGGGGSAFMINIYCPAGAQVYINFGGGNTTLTWVSPTILFVSGNALIGTAYKGGDATSIAFGGLAATASITSTWGIGTQSAPSSTGNLANTAVGFNLMFAGTTYGRGGFTSPTTTAAGSGAVLITTYA